MQVMSLVVLMTVLIVFMWAVFFFAVIEIFESRQFRSLRYGVDAELDWDKGKSTVAGVFTLLVAFGGNCLVSSERGPVGIVGCPRCGLWINSVILAWVLISVVRGGGFFPHSGEDYVVMVNGVLAGPWWRRVIVGMMAIGMAGGPLVSP